ncbi:MAG: OmpA family protein [gamma proteobacterium symbiont of Bathyaustriella thionipta]|nr:OmpA family protein [gamma proteobacterium symbiont of Bathyaustriella thionipta]MCU7951170.1 OmpA family protein [gamma proteobacterium symbiont of Bathyaustriella thionipta]MCU7951793.1 OmpA family protein [gamma proteobacterium symbiont of Bathyaustriella thionipta]MCU7957675.1 OmpA family protein [gamma proteobacterium symbiont of Bathyaustriella thionipta]MCU7968072.1 OmpA family protein [gamma proteobacterium symbiont of Bathyaustriella thionipta]
MAVVTTRSTPVNTSTEDLELDAKKTLRSQIITDVLHDEETDSSIDEIAEEEGAPAWMVTFADLVTLLLVFFILLFSISSIETEQFKSVLSSIQIALNQNTPAASQIIIQQAPPSTDSEIEPIVPQPGMDKDDQPEQSDKDELVNDIESMIEEQRLGKFVYVYTEGERIIIRIKGTILFPSGDVELFEDAVPIFDDIHYLFKKYADYNIDIKGYTDDTPISTVRFPSNWELSAVRATTVLRFFIDQGIHPGRMSATGYSDLFPIAGNDTVEGRAQNRRVEFVLEKEEK